MSAAEAYCDGCKATHRVGIHSPEIGADEAEECELSYRSYLASERTSAEIQIPFCTPERVESGAWARWLLAHPLSRGNG